MYLYLSEEGRFEVLPEPLLKRFGTPTLVMKLALDSRRKLAREDMNTVLQNLITQGYHLQMPPKLETMLYRGE